MHVTIRQIFISFFWGLVLFLSANAEITPLRLFQTQWTIENGLPQSGVTSLAQTKDGYLWIGTFGGLARFDGVRFKIFNTSNAPQLKTSRIISLAVDKEDRLWIGTEVGDVITYKNGQFKTVDTGENYGREMVNDIYVDDTGVVWISGFGGARNCTDQGCQRVDFPKANLWMIRKDLDGNVWGVADCKLYRQINGQFVVDENLKQKACSLETNRDGGLWIGGLDELGIYQNGNYSTVLKYEKPFNIMAMAYSPQGEFWFNIRDLIYRIGKDKIESYKIKNVTAYSRQILFDKEGNLWNGRNVDGLFRLIPQRVETLVIEREDKFLGNQAVPINSIAQDNQGDVWLSSHIGLYRWHDGKVEKLTDTSDNSMNMPRGPILFDKDGVGWSLTTEGVQSFQDGKFTLHPDLIEEKEAGGGSLFEDSKKQLWYSCDDCGVYVSDKQKVIAKYSKENGLIENNINAIYEAKDGSMWFATESGVSQLKDGVFHNYTTENGLSAGSVRDIYQDKNGSLWFGTYGGGLSRFRDGKFNSITSRNGLYDDVVSRILIDEDEDFWMLGNRGIFYVNRQVLDDFVEGRVKRVYCGGYTTNDGLTTNEGNGGYQWAGLKAQDGKLWFPMINGVAIIDPNKKKLSPPTPLVEEVATEERELNLTNKIDLYPGDEDLQIHYTGISFHKPEQIQFRYRLLGFDDKEIWEEVGTRRTAYYAKIPPGHFRFQVIASNADGIWSENIAEIEIIVHPPFYQTWWFYILVGLTVCLFLYWLYRRRMTRLILEKELGEAFSRKLILAQEAERSRIAAEIHDNLGQQLLIIKNWAGFCLAKISKTSKIREQLTQINSTADIALNEVRSLAKNLSPHHLEKVGLTNTIRFMVKQIAESSQINFQTEIDEIDGSLPKESEINLYRIVQESVNNIVKHSQAKNAKVRLKKSQSGIQLSISDDGIGFHVMDTNNQNFGTGLNGIKERSNLLGSNLSIKSVPTVGTEINLEIKTVKYSI
ncbi:MAG: hypothetical protein K1X72_19150 [Pyrinomonadaceae bacterium]|nr:hypothetical protein [Pyrinomonadaceae bacterium]